MPITYARGAIPDKTLDIPNTFTATEFSGAHVIKLNHNKTAIIDAEDKPLIEGWTFFCSRHNNGLWYIKGYKPRVNGVKPMCELSRLIVTAAEMVDHHNSDRFNNRRVNLRESTRYFNQANCVKIGNTSSVFKGVSWHKSTQKWRAVLQFKNEFVLDERFSDEIDAALAYDMAAREYFEQHAALNFPIIGERSAITGVIKTFDSEVYPELIRR